MLTREKSQPRPILLERKFVGGKQSGAPVLPAGYLLLTPGATYPPQVRPPVHQAGFNSQRQTVIHPPGGIPGTQANFRSQGETATSPGRRPIPAGKSSAPWDEQTMPLQVIARGPGARGKEQVTRRASSRPSPWKLMVVLAFLLLMPGYLLLSNPILTLVSSSKETRQQAPASRTSATTGGPASVLAVPHIAPGDWPGYLSHNGGFNADETTITTATASQLKLRWIAHAQGAISTQPVEANNMVYWGSWDGLEHATDLNGHEVWATKVGWTHTCGSILGVASTATVAVVTINGQPTSVVFVGGGNAHFYALDAMSGRILWKTSLGSSPSHFIWSSPAVFDGNVYIGLASGGDCPTIQGQLISMKASTGTIQHIFNVVPSGCTGGGVWSSPTIDSGDDTLYFTTGNADSCDTEETFGSAIIEVHASDLSLVGYWRVPRSDWVIDPDFGATPTLFTAPIHGNSAALVGVAHKNGTYYAFQRGNLDKGPLWQLSIAQGGGCPNCGFGSISPSAWDGSRLYVAGGKTSIAGQHCAGSVRALDPATGTSLWQDCLSTGPVLAPVTAVPGLLTVEAGSTLIIVAASSGKRLFFYRDSNPGSVFYGGSSISHGTLYVGNFDGRLYAFNTLHEQGE